MENTIHASFASSLTDLCEVNSSFDSGTLRICYTGENRNHSFFSREDIERNLKTIYNCPLVANFDVENGTFGGHDMKVVKDADGNVRIINATEPVGVIPESAKVWFEKAKDENGTEHEYLFADVLLWKRQAAYEKIKNDGIVGHSMEINVKTGETIDGVYHIHDFEFTAFALLGDNVTPCFESSALEVFSASEFKKSMSAMMQELKDTYQSIDASDEAEDKNETDTEGGEEVLDEKLELAKKYGIDVDSLDFELDSLSLEELTEKFEQMQSENKPHEGEEDFALTQGITEEMERVLRIPQVKRDWGEFSRYCYVDCDMELGEVYAFDHEDRVLVGFHYEMNGDSIVIDFESRKRKKWVIADFEEGEAMQPPFADVFSIMDGAYAQAAESRDNYKSMLDEKTESFSALESEVEDLRKFKSDVESAKEKEEKDSVFAKFEKLSGVDAFEELKQNCADMTVQQIEEKCFAIKGRMDMSFGHEEKFTATPAVPKLPLDASANGGETEPYNGLFVKHGY